MPWPTPTDFRHAIQDPPTALADEELRGGEVARNARALPMLWSGNFASVYRIHCPATGKTWALKCFTREVSTRQERYRQIAACLKAARLPFIVPFVYLEQGIRVHGQWFPAVKMEWVEGQTLNRFVEESLEKPKMLRQLLELWPKLASRLREAGLAHADLQHGNVLLVPAADGKLALKLIDYDGMYVPTLAGTPSGELGHPNYQHPDRLRRHAYNADVDRFSHLVIYAAVQGLLTGRRDLWQRFNNDENLLFREEDFRRPAESEVFGALWDTDDTNSRALAGRLLLACAQPLEATPWLDHVVQRDRVNALTRTEQEAVSSLLAAGKALARLKLPAAAEAGMPSPPGPPAWPGTSAKVTAGEVVRAEVLPEAEVVLAKILPEVAVSTRPASQQGTLPAGVPPPLGTRLRAAGKSPPGSSAGALRAIDQFFRRVVGEDNDLLRWFFRAAAPAIMLLVIWLAVTQPWRQPPPVARRPAEQKPAAVDMPAIEQKHGPESAPALKLRAIPPQTIEVGKQLAIAVSVEDAKRWEGKLRYSLGPDAPLGAKIHPETGALTWTPAEEPGPGRYDVAVSAQGLDGRRAQTSLTITVTRPPPLPAKEIAADLGGGIKMELVLIPAGEFLMGSPDSDNNASDSEKPQHRVRIVKPFYLGKYLVTQEQWKAVMGDNPSHFKGPKNPVESVSWHDCQKFLEKLNRKVGGGGFSLPTEAHWEYACRAGSTTRYCFGDDESGLGGYAWYGANSGKTTHPVGEKMPNAWGLFDINGNVWQWCADWYSDYKQSSTDDPTGPTTGSSRVFRGGGWYDPARGCRSAGRNSDVAGVRYLNLGLRISRASAEGFAENPAPGPTPPLKLQAVHPQTIEAGKQLTVAISVEDAKRWEGKLRYSLGPGAPPGARIDPETGAFAWTPAEDPGPDRYDLTVSVQAPGGLSDQTSSTAQE